MHFMLLPSAHPAQAYTARGQVLLMWRWCVRGCFILFVCFLFFLQFFLTELGPLQLLARCLKTVYVCVDCNRNAAWGWSMIQHMINMWKQQSRTDVEKVEDEEGEKSMEGDIWPFIMTATELSLDSDWSFCWALWLIRNPRRGSSCSVCRISAAMSASYIQMVSDPILSCPN